MFIMTTFNKFITILSILIIITGSSHPYKILGIFLHPSISHFHFYNHIFKGLADAGHDVTLISHFSDENMCENYKLIKLPGAALTNTLEFNSEFFRNLRSYGQYSQFYYLVYKWGQAACSKAYNSMEIKHILQSNETYDVILLESFITDCLWGVAWYLKAPVITVTSCILPPWIYDRFGSPQIPSFMPSIFLQNAEKMSFLERITNFISIYSMKFLYEQMVDHHIDDILNKEFGSEIPSVVQLKKRTSLRFVNRHYSLSGSQPLSPALIEIGGIHITKSLPIETTIQKLLDNAENGVIYVCWGSFMKANSMPTEMRDNLLNAFATFNQTVLWKWDTELPENKPPNVYTQKWFQQKEILCHPNVRVFWTHGGLLGASETAYCGTAVVVTPLFADQFVNAAALINRGMGVLLQYEDITIESVQSAINLALDPLTQANAEKVSYAFKNRVQTPVETAVWWVEHVAATKGAPLTKSHSVFLPGYIYYSLDVYAVLVVLLLGTFSCIILLAKCCINKFKLNKTDELKQKAKRQ